MEHLRSKDFFTVRVWDNHENPLLSFFYGLKILSTEFSGKKQISRPIIKVANFTINIIYIWGNYQFIFMGTSNFFSPVNLMDKLV